jgi:hypothetical protein
MPRRPAALTVADARRIARAARLEGVPVRIVLPSGVVVEINQPGEVAKPAEIRL